MNQSTQNKHFNLHVSGVGYVNRIRWVEPRGRKADRFLACDIAALHGDSGKPEYTYFDCRVSGREAIDMVGQLKADVDAKRKVFVSFRIGDIYPHLYERNVRDEHGNQTGVKEPAATIKGRLLLLNSITINGEQVFRREPKDEAPATQPDRRSSAPQGDEPAPNAEAAPAAEAATA